MGLYYDRGKRKVSGERKMLERPPAGRNLSSLGCQPQVGGIHGPKAPKGRRKPARPSPRRVHAGGSAGPFGGLGFVRPLPGVDTPGWINPALRAERRHHQGPRLWLTPCTTSELL